MVTGGNLDTDLFAELEADQDTTTDPNQETS
jgi:hypothetical protein